MKVSQDPFVRGILQVIVNMVFYSILSSFSFESTTSFINLYESFTAFLFVFPLSIIVSSIILSSIILGIINTTILIYLYEPGLFTNRLFYVELLGIYAFSIIIVAIIFKFLGLRDVLIDILRQGSYKRNLVLPTNEIFHNYALFFASLSLILPLTTYGYSYLIGVLQNEEPILVKSTVITYLSINILISLIALTYSRSPLCGLKIGFLASFSALSLAPLITYTLEEIVEVKGFETLERIKPLDEEKGLLLGVVKARLQYGLPRRLYEDIEQEWIRDTRRKTWFWAQYEEILLIDPRKLPNKHVVIMGSSGSGKSLLAKHLLLEYRVKFNTGFIVFDPHNEYYILKNYLPEIGVYDASTLSLNPLELGRLNPRERAHQLSSIIMSLFRLGHLQRQAIEELIIKTYELKGIYVDSPSTWSIKPPTMNDVLDICMQLMEENELYKRVYPYIRILADNVFTNTTVSLDKIMAKPAIITLNNLKSDYVRVLYVDTFLQRLLDMMYRREIKGEYIIVLDEAYTLLTRDYSKHIASRLLMESRKYGIGIVFITQHPLAIPTPIIENAAIKISFNITEPRNLDYVSKIFSGIYIRDKVNSIRNALRNLKSLNYILAISGLGDAFIVSEEEIAKPLIEHSKR